MHWGLRKRRWDGLPVAAARCAGWHRPSPGEDPAPRLPMNKTRHQRARDRQCGAHMGGSHAFSVKTRFLVFFSSPPPTLSALGPRDLHGTGQKQWGYADPWSQLPKAARGAALFLSSSMGCSNWLQVNSHCHPGVFSIIFLGLCRLNSSSATLLCNLVTNPTSALKLSLCNPYFTCSMSNPLANSLCSQMQRPRVRGHDGFSTASPILAVLPRHCL